MFRSTTIQLKIPTKLSYIMWKFQTKKKNKEKRKKNQFNGLTILNL